MADDLPKWTSIQIVAHSSPRFHNQSQRANTPRTLTRRTRPHPFTFNSRNVDHADVFENASAFMSLS